MIEFEKPNGTKILLNEEKATLAKAEELGWKRAENKPKRGRPAKAKEE